jgi:heptaprenylglyceryl phosphate synthase
MSQPPNPLTPMFIGVLLGAAVLLFGGGISSILTTRELARI